MQTLKQYWHENLQLHAFASAHEWFLQMSSAAFCRIVGDCHYLHYRRGPGCLLFEFKTIGHLIRWLQTDPPVNPNLCYRSYRQRPELARLHDKVAPNQAYCVTLLVHNGGQQLAYSFNVTIEDIVGTPYDIVGNDANPQVQPVWQAN